MFGELLFGNAVGYYSLLRLTPRLFSVSYIVLFIGIALNIKKKNLEEGKECKEEI